MKTRIILAALAIVLLIINSRLSIVRAQGSLTPPGAPAPTMKTLAQVEPRMPISSLPYSITNPGSYYVTTNLTGVSGLQGITIIANDVTLDLSGYTLFGVNGALSAIYIVSSYTNIVVRNGTVTGWGGYAGVDGYSSGWPRNVAYENLNLYGNSASGLEAEATSSIRNCQATGNGADGLYSFGGIISDCVARDNKGYGIDAQNSEVHSCLVHFNTNGIYANNSTVTECDVLNNAANGITLGSSCRIMKNRIANHTGSPGDAFLINGGMNYIAENSVINNAFGLYGSGTSVTNNLVIQNRFINSIQTGFSINNVFPTVILTAGSSFNFASTNSFVNIFF